MNKIILSGNLGRDGELKYAAGSGKAVLNFSIGVARGFKKEDGTDWVNCVVFDKRAESLAEYLVKGQRVLVEGQLRINSYTDKEGNKKIAPSVNVSNVELIGAKGEKKESHQDEDMQFIEGEPPF